jgi:hypothetical protein
MLVLAKTACALIQPMVQATSATALKAIMATLIYLMDARVGIPVYLIDAYKYNQSFCHFIQSLHADL